MVQLFLFYFSQQFLEILKGRNTEYWLLSANKSILLNRVLWRATQGIPSDGLAGK